ncbi:MAG TPA: hypothetical protein VMZ30_07335 [Pyrinomonadaceae bacterium]|nr:hypothetical protein [Pyrinomonadaceae bacterium]
MYRLAALTILICFSLSCQNYSTGLQQSVAHADETAATGALRTIATAQQTYALSNSGNYGTFQQLSESGYLDSRFNAENPVIKDYVLSVEVGQDSEGPFFRCKADPSDNKAGRHFYIDQSRMLRVNATQPAKASDPPAQP